MGKKNVISGIDGAVGSPISDDDLREDEDEVAVGEETLPNPEDASDLPEGLPDREEPQGSVTEPTQESEIDRLKRLGVYRPGLIESVEDLTKSYRNIETFVSQTKRVPANEAPPQPQIDPNRVYQDFQNEFDTNPVNAVLRIAAATQDSMRRELDGLREESFLSGNAEAQKYRDEIKAVRDAYPGISVQDAFNQVRGAHIDEILSTKSQETVQQVRRQETDKVLAQRERAGGVRTTPLSPEEKLNATISAAKAKGLKGRAFVDAMKEALPTDEE